MQKRLSRAGSTNLNHNEKYAAPTPSPNSTDDLLPTLEEVKQVMHFCSIAKTRVNLKIYRRYH